jgi:hypothetical protein
MLIKDQALPSSRPIETDDDFAEARLEATGYIFHGALAPAQGKRPAKAGTNLLHFARCAKLDRVPTAQDKIWYRTITIAKQHLDATVGQDRWKWCKLCEKEITQKLINEQ